MKKKDIVGTIESGKLDPCIFEKQAAAWKPGQYLVISGVVNGGRSMIYGVTGVGKSHFREENEKLLKNLKK